MDRFLAAVHSPTGHLNNLAGPAQRHALGEISELRGRDVALIDLDDLEDNDESDAAADTDAELVYLNVCRSVSSVGARHAGGGRFLVEDTPKSGRDRKIGLDALTSTKLLDHLELHDVGPDDLIFTLTRLQAEIDLVPKIKPELVDLIPGELGRTEPNSYGRTYAHGTASGSGPGRCRCLWCRRAIAQFRAVRRQAGHDLKPRVPSSRGRNISDHVPRDYFRRNIWLPALARAEITSKATFHDLRHTHATWLARDGFNFEVLRERLGHASLVTTQQYISASRRVDTTAAQAMARLMTRTQKQSRRRNLRALG